jgi:poly-gamma-glutamate synthesis protein (capsule biosynthesis protein)
VNPLRFRTEYVVPPEVLDHARKVDAALRHDGFDLEQHRWRADRALTRREGGDGYLDLLGHRLVAGDAPAVRSTVEPRDLEAQLRMVREARRQADWVLVSLHAHDFDATKDQPPNFMSEFAHACVDAGADALFGHGPHLLRGIEIYERRPIFYSLGNFVFHLDLFPRQPADAYERVGLDPFTSVPGDLYGRRSGGSGGFGSLGADRRYWESVVAVCELQRDEPPRIRLHPIELRGASSGPDRGVPRLAEGEQAREILELLAGLSAPFGTKIAIDGATGVVR